MPLAWFDNVTLTVEAALSAATGTYGVWDTSVWDTATWGPDIVWTDISRWARSIKTSRKFSRDLQIWQAGQATVELDNTDGRFGPANMSSPYVTAGVTGVRPWRPIRISATYAGTTYYLFSGYAMDWVESWDPADAVAVVTVPCVDEWARLQNLDGLAVTPVGAGERSGARIQRVLNAAGHTGPRAIDIGRVTVQATDLSKAVVDELAVTTDSEGGAIFIDADSTVVYEQAYALMENARSNTVQATFVDAHNAGLPYADLAMTYGGSLVKNIAAFTRLGGSTQTVVDQTSRALSQDQRETRTDLVCETDDQALALATFFVARYKDPEYRPELVSVLPRADPARLYPAVLGRRVRDLVRIVRTPTRAGYTITSDCHVAGISHNIVADNWAVDFDLWSAAVYQTYAASRWDVATWDNASWFF